MTTKIRHVCAGNSQRSVVGGAISRWEYATRVESGALANDEEWKVEFSDGGINVEKLKAGTIPADKQARLIFVGVRDKIVGYENSAAKEIAEAYSNGGPAGINSYLNSGDASKAENFRKAFFEAQPKVHEQLYREICQVMGTEAHIPEKYFHGFNKPLNLQDNLQYILLSDEVDREKVVGRYKSSAEVGSPLRVGDRCIVDVLAPNPAERVVDVENSIQVLFPKIIGVHEFCGLEGSIEDDPAGGLKQARHIVQQYMDLRTNLVDRAIESHRNFVKAAITYATLIEPE